MFIGLDIGMNASNVRRLELLLVRSELNSREQELMRQFFNSIEAEPQFLRILDLLEQFPIVFESFCNCFSRSKQDRSEAEWRDFLKQRESEAEWRDFMKQNKSEAEWVRFLAKEDDVIIECFELELLPHREKCLMIEKIKTLIRRRSILRFGSAHITNYDDVVKEELLVFRREMSGGMPLDL